ncbi:MAG: hypothetical protein ACI94Y_000153 [Maribacter sp.]|jgi:hypothetical protein
MKKILFLFIAIAMYSLNISAQDNCATATVLPDLDGGGTHSETATIITAGTLGGVGEGAGTYSAVWFSFTPTQGGLIDVASCLGGVDTNLHIFDDCAGPMIGDDDDSCPFAPDGSGSSYASEIIGQGVAGGTTYYIEWDDRWSVGPFDWSITFTPVNAPDCATLTAPADAGIDQATTVDLTWDAAVTGSAATSYDVYFGETSGALPMVGNQAGTTYNAIGLSAGTTYYWSVSPVNTGGTTDCSGMEYSFTVATVVCDAPTAVAAVGVTATDAMVTWADGPGCLTDQIVTITPAVAGSPFSVACGVQTLDLAGLLIGGTSYTAAVTNNCGSLPSTDVIFNTLAINDFCSGAIPITPSASGTGCTSPAFTLPFTTDGTTDSGVPTVCSDPGNDQWFTWTATSTGLTFSSQNPGSPGIAVFASCADAAAGTQIACTATFANADISGWNVGDDLLIQIYDFGGSTSDVAFCLEETCEAATAGAASAITDVTADITWVDGLGCTTAQTVTVVPAVAGSPFSVDCGIQTLSLTDLDATTAYTVTIANDCGASPSSDVAFTTLSACDAPTGITASNITLTTADLVWLDGPGCTTSQTVTITPTIAGSPFSMACGTQMLSLTGLTEATTYTVVVANDCDALPSAMITFDSGTPGTACATAVVLPNLAGGGTHSETATVIIDNSGGGIGDAGATYDAAWFSYTPATDGLITVSSCLGGVDTRLYIHDNCAGPSIATNDDTCPFAPDGTGSSYASELVDLAVTSGTTYYIEWDDRWAVGPFDWSITFTAPVVLCDTPPSNVAAEATGATSVYMTWDMVPGTALYQVKYRERGTTVWSKFSTAFTQRSITGLNGNKQYQYKIRRQCDNGGWSDYSPTTMFPSFYSSTCDEPTGVSTVYLDNTSFKVRWYGAGEVKGRVRYREVGTTTWLIRYGLPGKNFIYVTDLVADASYEYRVRLNCNDNEWSPYNTLYFHNLGGVTTRMSQELTGVRLYPNPASNVLNIAYDNELGTETTVEVFDILGRAIISEISNDNQVILNVGQLNAGTYIVSIMVDGKQSIQKFVKK